MYKITKREFIQLTMGGLTGDAIAQKIDAASNIPHVPSESKVTSVLNPLDPENFRPFWGDGNWETSKRVIVPAILYARFESTDLIPCETYGGFYMQVSWKNLRNANSDHWDYEPVLSEPFEKGGFPFADPFLNNRPKPGNQLTEADSNFHGDPSENSLRAPEYFATRGIGIILDRNTSDGDVALFERSCVVRYIMGSRCYLTIIASRVTARADMDKLVKRGCQPTELISAKTYRTDPPLLLEQCMPFSLSIYTRPKTQFGAFGGYVMLDGYYMQGIC